MTGAWPTTGRPKVTHSAHLGLGRFELSEHVPQLRMDSAPDASAPRTQLEQRPSPGMPSIRSQVATLAQAPTLLYRHWGPHRLR